MSGVSRKQPAPVHSNRRSPSAENQPSPGGGGGNSTRTPTTSQTSSSGLGRSPSGRQSPTPVSARAAARRPGTGRSNLSMSSVPKDAPNQTTTDDDVRAENAATIDELKEQVKKAETVSDQYQKQLGVLQMRLDDAVAEQTKYEEQAQEKDSTTASLREEVRELTRRLREQQQAHDTDHVAMVKEKENHATREDELQSTILRLKETIAQKDMRMGVENDRNQSRSPNFRNRSGQEGENGQFAPSSQLQRSPSRNNSTLILQKDKLIESLRLELAEAQIKLVEMENTGGGRREDLEKELLEARMANARLMEDNESYQLLLSEKTLNGDFTKADFMSGPGPDVEGSANGMGSLADELESAGDGEGEESDSRRRQENENKNLKDQNKALSLYIERIIGRLLQHEGFEDILHKNDTEAPGRLAGGTNKDKDLPPPPPPEKSESAGQSFLQRARSVVSGQNARPHPQPPQSQPRARPASQYIPPSSVPESQQPTTHENPSTAPSIPIGRSRTLHRRTRSDQATAEGPAAASVVGQMYSGPATGTASTGPMSPGISPTLSGQSTFFSGSTNTASRRDSSAPAGVASVRSHERVVSSAGSATSDRSGEVTSTAGTSSPPRSNPGMNNYTGAVMAQSKLRPLRLVRENQEENDGETTPTSQPTSRESDEIARKKANRGSWISWFNQPKGPGTAN